MSAEARSSFRPSAKAITDEAIPDSAVRTGDLLLCAGTSPMSRLIQRATGSPWSHVALLVRVESIDRILVFESVESIGVRAVSISCYLGEGESRAGGYDGRIALARHEAISSLSKPATEAMLRRATDLLGRRYDTAEILRIAGRIAFGGEARRVADRAAQPPCRDDLYICSEYVWECLRAAEIDIAHDRRGFIAPADFAADPSVHLVRELAAGSPGGLDAAIR